MMSPDPPRAERDQPEEERPNGSDAGAEFVTVWDEIMNEEDGLMFVPQGPHELDLGGSDSDYSTSDDEENPEGQSARLGLANGPDEAPVEGSQARGFYQLLIPFPASTNQQDDDEEEVDEPEGSQEQSQVAQSPKLDMIEISKSDDKSENAVLNEEESKREIELTEEKVETIKSVMKSFSLPPSSIPSWASQLDEDSWKEKLSTTIHCKPND